MSKLYYCVGCNEAVETIDFVTKVGYSGLFYSERTVSQSLGFCPNEECPRYGLATFKINKHRLSQQSSRAKTKSGSRKNAPNKA